MFEVYTQEMKARALLADEWPDAPLEIIEYIAGQMCPQHDKAGIFRKLDTPSGNWMGLMIEEGDVSTSMYVCLNSDRVELKYDSDRLVDVSHVVRGFKSEDGFGWHLYLFDRRVLVLWDTYENVLYEVITRGPTKVQMKLSDRSPKKLLIVKDGCVTCVSSTVTHYMCRSMDLTMRREKIKKGMKKNANWTDALSREKVGFDLRKLESPMLGSGKWKRRLVTFVSRTDAVELTFSADTKFDYELIDNDLLIMTIGGQLHELWFDTPIGE